MSDQTPQANSQQTLVIALVVVAVLLAAIVGLLVFQQSKAANPSVPVAVNPNVPITPGAATGAATPGAAGSTGSTPFDAKTAPKVPANMTPEAYVKAYNEAVVAGKYDVAYKMLPIDKQKSYGSAAAYGDQVKGYGISGYKVGTPTTNGDTVSVVAEQDTSAMNITYTWNFKKVGNTYYVDSRVMGGTVQ